MSTGADTSTQVQWSPNHQPDWFSSQKRSLDVEKLNGRSASPLEEPPGGTLPSPKLRHYSGSTTPTRTPTPTRENLSSAAEEEKPAIKTKSVSFHSGTNWRNVRRIQSARDCLEYMMEGSSMIKLRSNGRQYHRYFCLLEDLSAIRWSPSSKKTCRAQVPMDQMKEIRTGRNCESLRHKTIPTGYNEERIFSILYGSSYESLDLIAQSPEEANIWVTGLNALIGASQSPDDPTKEDPEMLRESWLRESFVKATQDCNGSIDQATCIDLIKRLDNQVVIERVRQKLQEIDHNKTDGLRGRVEIQEFIDIFKEIATRPEIYFLMIRYANKDYLTINDFHLFLEGEQGMTGLSEDDVLKMILKYEPSPEARRSRQLLVDGFTKYLLSEECDIFDPMQREVCQDMTQPLAHYFVSTSHDTYLLEDQIKGPASVDGYVRVLTCGCRCVKIDVWDGPDEPLVFHRKSLTNKIIFRDVIDAISTYSFDYSVYPVFIHIENHCSLRQQQMMAEILKALLGSSLYVHPPGGDKALSEISPEELKFKIILLGKRRPDNLSQDEISDDDLEEEQELDSFKFNEIHQVPLCRELSSLVSVTTKKFDDHFHNTNASRNTGLEYMWSLSELRTTKLTHTRPEECVEHNKNSFAKVYPKSSRDDSSNYNPLDFWNAGCQMVAMNFQTPGQNMDVYEGKFRSNGACGYVLKPTVMREHVSVFSANSRETIPGVAPQILKIKIISGQCLPKPRGSTAVKAFVVDPYVVIQIFGIPADCSEAKTRTVSNDGNSPMFDESFEFLINLPEMALVRFIVIDDESIGDAFIGQCSIPFECLQTGYRHMRLLSSMGEPLDNATLFVHISISNKRGGKSHSSWGRKSQKLQVQLKGIGFKQADDIFKEALTTLSDAEQRQISLENVWNQLQEECGLEHTANIKQCLKVIIKRFLSQPGNHRLSIVKENGIPFLRVSKMGPLPPHLHKLEAGLEKLLLEIHHFQKEASRLTKELMDHLQPALSLYDTLEECLSKNGIKGKKGNRARENFAYNVRVIRGQLDRLDSLEKKGKTALKQVESTKTTLGSIRSRDKSPSLRERQRLNLTNKHNTSENLSNYGSLGRSPTSPSSYECKPKSILKKSNSNIESRSMGYVYESHDLGESDSPSSGIELQTSASGKYLLKPPLHHSLSYTPGFSFEHRFIASYDPLATSNNNMSEDLDCPRSRPTGSSDSNQIEFPKPQTSGSSVVSSHIDFTKPLTSYDVPNQIDFPKPQPAGPSISSQIFNTSTSHSFNSKTNISYGKIAHSYSSASSCCDSQSQYSPVNKNFDASKLARIGSNSYFDQSTAL